MYLSILLSTSIDSFQSLSAESVNQYELLLTKKVYWQPSVRINLIYSINHIDKRQKLLFPTLVSERRMLENNAKLIMLFVVKALGVTLEC